MRRLRSPASFKGGELVVDIGSYIGVDLVTFLRHALHQLLCILLNRLRTTVNASSSALSGW